MATTENTSICVLCAHAPICKNQPQQSCPHFQLKEKRTFSSAKQVPQPEKPIPTAEKPPKKIKWSALFIGFCAGVGAFLVTFLMIAVPVAYSMGIRSRYQLQRAPFFTILAIIVLIVSFIGMGYVTARLARPYPKRNTLLLAVFVSAPATIATWMTPDMWRSATIFILIMIGAFLLPVEKKPITAPCPSPRS